MQQFKQLTDRIWYQTPVSETDRPIVAVITGDDRSLVIDAGNSSQHATLFLEEMEESRARTTGSRRIDALALGSYFRHKTDGGTDDRNEPDSRRNAENAGLRMDG